MGAIGRSQDREIRAFDFSLQPSQERWISLRSLYLIKNAWP